MKCIFVSIFILMNIKGLSQDLYAKADSEYYYGDIAKAIEFYTKSIKNNVLVPESYMMRGAAKAHLNDFPDAILDLNEAYCKNRNLKKIYFYYGMTYFLNSLYDKAITYFDSAILKVPDDTSSYDYRAMSKIQTGNFRSAIADENIAIKLDSTELGYYTNRGYAFFRVGEYFKALHDLDRSISLEPTRLAYANRGMVNYKLKKYNSAVNDFTFSLGFDSTAMDLFYYRGLAYIGMNKSKKGCDDIKKAIEMGFIKKDDIVCTQCKICNK